MFDRLKERCRSRYVTKNVSITEKRLATLRSANLIGIIASISSEADFEEICSVYKQLHKDNKTVKMILYFDEKEVPPYCLNEQLADCFCKKDINWLGISNSTMIIDFLNTIFDVIIDFTCEALKPIEVILQCSKSKFITGGNSFFQNFYDLYMHNDSNNRQLLLQNIDFYTYKLSGSK
ncbi:MAG: hypothetical protein LBU51_09895 [Bacteroidales bacterium]|jgi:hypothetical protein|nr:hypothetical protein [Bacteroidales bacterium]